MKHAPLILLSGLLLLLALAPTVGALPSGHELWAAALTTGGLGIAGLILLSGSRDGERKLSPVPVRSRRSSRH